MKYSLLASVSSVALGVGVLIAAPGTAEAGLSCVSGACTETVTTGAGTHLGGAATQMGDPVTLDFFVPGVNQRLTSIVITETGAVTPTGGFTATQTGTYKAGVSTNLSVAAGTNTPANFPFLSVSSQLVKQTFVFTSAPDSPNVHFTGNVALGTPQTLTTGLNNFVKLSASTFTVDFLGSASQFESGQGITGYNMTSTGVGTITITYNYTTSVPTPEPASMAVLGVGLVGAGVIRRRRKAV